MSSIIICDTREKGNKKILEYFDKIGQDYIVSKLDYGDYMLYKNNSVVIDRKDSLLELAGNLCHSSEHDRVRREIQRAKEDGCENFIFLIAATKIKTVDDLKNWSSPYTKVTGETLMKVMTTMKKKYGVRFIICPKRNMGKKILEILESEKNNED